MDHSRSLVPGAVHMPAWGGDGSGLGQPSTERRTPVWPWPGGVVSTLDFDPMQEGDKAYYAVAVVRGGAEPDGGMIVDRSVCLQCGRTCVRTSPMSAFADTDLHQASFETWAGLFADIHDREACTSPYSDATVDAASTLTDLVTAALDSPAAGARFLEMFAHVSLAAVQEEWGVLVATPHGVRFLDAGIAGLTSMVTLDGSPLTRDHDAALRSAVSCLGGSEPAVPVLVAVASNGYDLGVGVRRWTILAPNQVLVCETGPDPEMPTALGLAVGLDAYSRPNGQRQFIPPERVRVAMMLSDGFNLGAGR